MNALESPLKEDIFTQNMKAYFAYSSHSLYEILMDLRLEVTNNRKMLYAERSTTFDTRLRLAKQLSTSPKMRLSFGTMARWLAESYLPPEVLGAVDSALLHEQNQLSLLGPSRPTF